MRRNLVVHLNAHRCEGPLSRVVRYTSSATPEALRARLTPQVHLHSEGFQLVSRLSGGGVVIRTIRAPQTDRTWLGDVGEHGFRLVLVPHGEALTPFQPILRGRWTAADGRADLRLDLAPHPGARLFPALFLVAGGVLVLAGLLLLLTAPPMGLMALAMGGLLLLFPQIRARHGFALACQQSLDALEQDLPLERAP